MKVAVIGTGLMGSAIADAVLTAGHQLVVYDREAARMSRMVDKGASAAATVAEAVRHAEVTILVLPDARCVEDALFGDERTKDALRNKRILNASTTNALEIASIAKRVNDAGGSLAEMSIMVARSGPRQRVLLSAWMCGQRRVRVDPRNPQLWPVPSSRRRGGDASKAEAPIVFASALGS
jgi:3-hydroxyisobutyrate dehydrogenase-like beta-hydroxyacid dehydrogenase